MHVHHALAISYLDALPLLDAEFDKMETSPALMEHNTGPTLPGDELAWDDQLDNGDDLSL